MAQINLTLNQEEILELMANNSGDAFKTLLQNSLNAILQAESAEQLKAAPYERCSERTDMRNGSRERTLITRIGSFTLTVPRHRNASFETLVFDNYSRSEAALVSTMAEMVVAGVSTAKVGRVMKEICGRSFSKQEVSKTCKKLDEAVGEFKMHPLDNDYLFLMVDATYLKVRREGKVRPCALLIAVGLTKDGHKEILGFDVTDTETTQSWTAFLESLKARGLTNVAMFTSDEHKGILAALQKVYPDIPWQRCQAHFARNIADAAPKSVRTGLRSELTEMFNSSTIEAARKRRDEIIADYTELAPKAMECLDAGFDDAMTVMELPKEMRRCVRTSNYLERLNKEVKKRSKVIGIFPNKDSVVRLIGAFLMEENDRWSCQGRIYFSPACADLDKRRLALIEIARTQVALAKAA